MKRIVFGTAIIALLALGFETGAAVDSSGPNKERADLGAIFGDHCRCLQVIDQFGTISRSAFDKSDRRIGIQVGTYNPGERNKMTVEMTYLEPDATHPRGRAFDGAGNPTPLE